MKNARFLSILTMGFLLPLGAHSKVLISIPETFDFGWSPDNAKISCEFIIKNTGQGLVPLNSLRPSCGCTAANFTPGILSSNEETKIGLTFNTRGYKGVRFRKPADLKTNSLETGLTVKLTGFVQDSKAQVYPLGSGIAAFEPGSKVRKKTIKIKNTTNNEISLDLVQKPAEWAQIKLNSDKISPQGTINLSVKVKGPYDKPKHTSVTFEAVDKLRVHRFTVAIRTGPPPPSPRQRRLRGPRKNLPPLKDPTKVAAKGGRWPPD